MIPHEKKQFPIINKQVGRAGVYHSQKEKEKKEGFFHVFYNGKLQKICLKRGVIFFYVKVIIPFTTRLCLVCRI